MRAETISAIKMEAPWRTGLSKEASGGLELRDIQSLPSESTAESEVVIVGGGIAGLSAAIAAAQAGAKVLLLERGLSLGEGASGRNAGILSPGVNMPLVHMPAGSPAAALWSQTNEVMNELLAETSRGGILNARRTGTFVLATSRTAARRLVQESRARAAHSLRAEPVAPDFVTERTAGRLSVSGVEMALWLPDEGRIHPLTLLAYLAKQARKAGVTLAGGARVVRSSEEETVRSGGRLSSWRLSLENGMSVVSHALIRAVGPVADATARIYALAFAAELPDDFPVYWDANPYVYYDYRPGDGRLVVSGGRYGKAGAISRDRAYHDRMGDAARRWLPELSGVEPTHAWAVDLNVSADLLPALARYGKEAPGVSIEGLGALGVLPGIVLGRRAGREMAGYLNPGSR